jgi:hypothetical protein
MLQNLFETTSNTYLYGNMRNNSLHDLTLIKNTGLRLVGRGSIVIFITAVRDKCIDN